MLMSLFIGIAKGEYQITKTACCYLQKEKKLPTVLPSFTCPMFCGVHLLKVLTITT
jgi:hypothetical protein